MKIVKKGIIYRPAQTCDWNQLYGMMPTPVYIKGKGYIRIFFGTTDTNRFGITTYIDVNADNPSEIVHDPERIVLGLGAEGFFDDCGAIPSSVVCEDDSAKLYYVGFQRCFKVPYMLFSGLATTVDLDSDFTRYSSAPLLDRSIGSPISNAAPFVLKENGLYKMWFWEGEEWLELNGKKYIKAMISYAISNDGVSWEVINRGCIRPIEGTEFSVGRPWVVRMGNKYKMFFSVRFIDKLYRITSAESIDGINWLRDPGLVLDVSGSDWESDMVCYPAVVSVGDKNYLFYNGNNNGETGFGYAEIVDFGC